MFGEVFDIKRHWKFQKIPSVGGVQGLGTSAHAFICVLHLLLLTRKHHTATVVDYSRSLSQILPLHIRFPSLGRLFLLLLEPIYWSRFSVNLHAAGAKLLNAYLPFVPFLGIF